MGRPGIVSAGSGRPASTLARVSQYDPYTPREAEEPQVGYSPIKQPLTPRDLLRKLWAPIAAVGFLFWKLKFLFAAIFKFKLFTVAGSMLVSIGAYALLWGWQFAVGFVLLLLVHELGHVLRGEAPGTARLGADVHPLPRRADHAEAAARQRLGRGEGRDRRADPGQPRRRSCLARSASRSTRSCSSRSRFTGFFLNLFNLAPISPLDGGRIVAAIHPALWLVGLAALVGLDDRGPEPDPDPDPRPRRARVLAALADAEPSRGRGVLPGQPAAPR